ncbi:transporter substrate-binding domain-containing protein [Roseibium aggregatum]|uniref:Transporter substrate-binding domain-containing protein n=1 Tax=Roseibium aggregatum TaxID=187304 RepID=A0A939EFH8_9HYPH|nr:transporter substrate-binding domain-containing protein [Roseibium aggregatum]MBN9671213.1 transporter substrate-binding domain-containing protein [Roseibium aggregatum]
MTKTRVLTALALLLPSLSVAPGVAAEALEDAVSRGTLQVGIASENLVPWLANDKTGGRMGYEIDVASAVAGSLGVDLTFVEMPYDELFASLKAGDVDVIISGVSISADRAREVYFSSPYGGTDFTLVVDKTGLPEGAAGSGYDHEGIRIGVLKGSIAEATATNDFKSSELVPYEDPAAMRDAFLDGSVSGAIVPTPYPAFIVARDPGRYAAEETPLVSTRQGMVTRPDSPHMLNFLNAWIVENEANGFLEDLQVYWFESGEWLDMLEGYSEKAE